MGCKWTKKNIVKTTQIKYAIINFGWWNLKIQIETIFRWRNVWGENVQSLGDKKKKRFRIDWNLT